MAKKPAPETVLTLEQERDLRVADLRGRFGDEVTLYPIDGVWITDVPHQVQTVGPERADELLGYFPQAFTTVKPPDPPTTDETAGDDADAQQEV